MKWFIKAFLGVLFGMFMVSCVEGIDIDADEGVGSDRLVLTEFVHESYECYMPILKCKSKYSGVSDATGYVKIDGERYLKFQWVEPLNYDGELPYISFYKWNSSMYPYKVVMDAVTKNGNKSHWEGTMTATLSTYKLGQQAGYDEFMNKRDTFKKLTIKYLELDR